MPKENTIEEEEIVFAKCWPGAEFNVIFWGGGGGEFQIFIISNQNNCSISIYFVEDYKSWSLHDVTFEI